LNNAERSRIAAGEDVAISHNTRAKSGFVWFYASLHGTALCCRFLFAAVINYKKVL